MKSSPTPRGLSPHRKPAGSAAILSLVLLLGATACPPAPSSQQSGSGGSSDDGSGGNASSGGSTGSGGHGSGGNVGSGGSGSGGSSSGGSSGSGGSATGGSASGGAAGGKTGGGGAAGAAAAGHSGGAGSGAGGAAGGTTGAGGAAPSCTDGIQNGSETGVDCGGSCMTTCVTYKTGMPNSDGNVANACTGGNGFICPRFMMFSPEMKQAAADDGKDNSWPVGAFNYAVVTLNGAKCCDCYQIVYSSLQNGGAGVTPPKAVIGQNFNQGGVNNAFDVFVGKGGEGAQTAGCAKMYSSYPSIGEPNGGGISALSTTGCTGMGASLSSQTCVTAIENACDMIKANSSYVQQTTQTSCIESNQADSLYHQNWNVKAQRIECPQHLTEVTGCRLNAQSLPKADPTIQTASDASSWSSYGTTTMQDCCKPSCAWPNNVSNTQGGWSTFYQCSMDGTPMTK